MFLKHLFNYSIFVSVSASWLNGHLVCMVLLVELDVLFWPQRLVLAAEAGVLLLAAEAGVFAGCRSWCWQEMLVFSYGHRGWCYS